MRPLPIPTERPAPARLRRRGSMKRPALRRILPRAARPPPGWSVPCLLVALDGAGVGRSCRSTLHLRGRSRRWLLRCAGLALPDREGSRALVRFRGAQPRRAAPYRSRRTAAGEVAWSYHPSWENSPSWWKGWASQGLAWRPRHPLAKLFRQPVRTGGRRCAAGGRRACARCCVNGRTGHPSLPHPGPGRPLPLLRCLREGSRGRGRPGAPQPGAREPGRRARACRGPR